jgi:branched-chain amino acid transport system permease protein
MSLVFRWGGLPVFAACVAGLAVLPVLAYSPGTMDIVILICCYGLLALALNTVVGGTGLIAFGHGMFFGLGAYLYGIGMQQLTYPIPLTMLAAVLATGVIAAAVGAICARLHDVYFSFLTIAFQLFFHSLALSWQSLTGGDQGLLGGVPRPPFLGIDLSRPLAFYLFVLFVTAAAIALLRIITLSQFGAAMRMVRDNVDRARFVGLPVYRVKVLSFTVSAMFASLGGALLAMYVSGAFPSFLYWTTSGQGFFMLLIGGMNIFWGPLIGAAILSLLNHLFTTFATHYGLFLGSTILLIAIGLRKGLVDWLVEDVRPRLARLGAARARAGVVVRQADPAAQ